MMEINIIISKYKKGKMEQFPLTRITKVTVNQIDINGNCELTLASVSRNIFLKKYIPSPKALLLKDGYF